MLTVSMWLDNKNNDKTDWLIGINLQGNRSTVTNMKKSSYKSTVGKQ